MRDAGPDETQRRQAMLLGVAYNIYLL